MEDPPYLSLLSIIRTVRSQGSLLTSNMSKLHRSLGQRFPFFISASKCPCVIMDLIFEKIFSIRLAPGSQNIGKLRGGFLVDKIFNCRKRQLRSFNDEQ